MNCMLSLFLFPYQIVMFSSEWTINLIQIVWFICNSRKKNNNNDKIINMQEEKLHEESYRFTCYQETLFSLMHFRIFYFLYGSMFLWKDEKEERFYLSMLLP